MNCPRCTHAIPEESSFCPRCGLDLAKASVEPDGVAEDFPPEAELEAAAQEFEPEPEFEGEGEPESGGLWPSILRIHATRGPKRPMVAATLAFFFGPFTYLYLEQANWFWWGLLGGFFFILVSRLEAIPILLIGYMLHAYDVAQLLNEEHETPIEDTPEVEIEAL